MPAHFYILRLTSGKLYPGATSDLDRRWTEHCTGKGGRTTALDLPTEIAYHEEHPDFSSARCREAQIKRWSRKEKDALVAGDAAELRKLSRSHDHGSSRG